MASGKYMFGRGIFDMKSGDANVMWVSWKWFPEDIENFEGTSSLPRSMRRRRKTLTGNACPSYLGAHQTQKEFGYDYQAMLDPDYIAPAYPGDLTFTST